MLNDYKVPGQTQPGLTEAEVQLLMGHKDINSTRRYAKLRSDRLQAKLLAHDQKFIQGDADGDVRLVPPCLALPEKD